jgi:hypothetical protein
MSGCCETVVDGSPGGGGGNGGGDALVLREDDVNVAGGGAETILMVVDFETRFPVSTSGWLQAFVAVRIANSATSDDVKAVRLWWIYGRGTGNINPGLIEQPQGGTIPEFQIITDWINSPTRFRVKMTNTFATARVVNVVATLTFEKTSPGSP